MDEDTRFWNATERAEQDFTGRADVREFRRLLKRLGHEESVIRERVEAIHPELLDEFDAIEGKPGTRLKTRKRDRFQASPPRGLKQEWTEWQVIDGRRVVARFDTDSEADAWIERHGAEYPRAAK
jgi:hypothetical protein